MKKEDNVLNKRERDVLVLCAENRDCRHLTNTEIAQRLGVSIGSVKEMIYRACVKLEAHNRGEAIVNALRKGEIGLGEICSLDELAKVFRSLGSHTLRKIADHVRRGLENECCFNDYERNYYMYRNRDSLLTKAEREVLILVGYGLTNKEIAERRYLSPSSVRTFLYRAYVKLGACRRADAVLLAIELGEIDPRDYFSLEELMRMFATLEAGTIEKIAQMVEDHTKGCVV